MQFKYFLFIITILSSSLLMSQNDFFLGVQAGPNLSFVRGNDLAEKNEGNISYHIGLSSELFIHNKISLSANLSYEKNSVSQKINALGFLDISGPGDPYFNNQTFIIKNNLEYLNLHLLARYYFNQRFYTSAGGFLGMFLNHTEKIDNKKSSGDTNEYYRDFNTGISLGLGTNFLLKNQNKISLELRANHGFTNISKVRIFDNGKLKTSNISLIINYSFKLKKNPEEQN